MADGSNHSFIPPPDIPEPEPPPEKSRDSRGSRSAPASAPGSAPASAPGSAPASGAQSAPRDPTTAGRKPDRAQQQNGPSTPAAQRLLAAAHDPTITPESYQIALTRAGITQAEAKRRALAIGRLYVPHIMDKMCQIAMKTRDERVAIAAGDLVLNRVLGKPKEAPPEVDENAQKKLDLRKLLRACDDDELETLKGVFKKIARLQDQAARDQETLEPVTADEEANGVPDDAPAPQQADLGQDFDLAEDAMARTAQKKSGMGSTPAPDLELYEPGEPTPADLEDEP